MIYLIGGAPRVGKSLLGQQVGAALRISWISTDIIMQVLKVHPADGIKTRWDASPAAIRSNAEWFLPYLERFIWGVNSLADHYLIEGVDFLPEQVAELSGQYPIKAIFLGLSRLTLESFDQFPGRSQGYGGLPEEFRRQIVQDVPLWSELVRMEAEQFGFRYVDMVDNFDRRVDEAFTLLTATA